MGQQRGEAQAGRDALVGGGGEADDEHGVGRRGKIVGGEGFPVPEVLCAGRGVTDVEPAAVVGYAGRVFPVGILYGQRAEGLVVFAVVPLYLPLQAVGFAVVLAVEGFAYGGYGLVGIGRRDLPVGLAGPEGDVVQGDALGVGPSVEDGSLRAVSDDEGFLEIGGRAVVVECQCVVFVCILCLERREAAGDPRAGKDQASF